MRVHGTSLTLDDETRIYGGSQGKLLLVADGMGGHAEGERACTIAVDQLTTYVLNSLGWCFRLEEDSERDFEEDLKHALESCQKSIEAVADRPSGNAEHGNHDDDGLHRLAAGLCRPCRRQSLLSAKSGQLDQITVDHTMSEVMSKAGQMSREDARHSPMGHVLVNVLGGRSHDLFVDVNKLSLERDDILLLCTDGLYDMIPDEQINELLGSRQSAEGICRNLVEQANGNGGKDNITAIVSRFLSPQADEPRAFVEAEVPLEEITAAK